MQNSAIIESTYFYTVLLVSIKNEEQRQEVLEMLLALHSYCVTMLEYMRANKLFFPRYHEFLKHSKKMLEIYEIDVLDLEFKQHPKG